MARCPSCDAEIIIGCNCVVDDGTCFEWAGIGTEDDPFVLLPVISADGDNLLTCSADGMSAVLPTAITEPPAVQAYHSVNQSIANNTLTTVALNGELYDPDTMHSPTTNNSRLTFTTAGTYIVTFNATWKNNTTGDRYAQIRKNGTDILCVESKDSGGADLILGHSLTIVELFAAGNYVEARVQQTSGAALLLINESYSPFLSAAKLA